MIFTKMKQQDEKTHNMYLQSAQYDWDLVG